MTKIRVPSVMCDHEDGCDQYTEDAHAIGYTVHYRGRVWRPTEGEPAEGWTRVGDEDFCPEHKP